MITPPSHPNLNWDDLRFLLALERERTLTAAAKHLGCNHTTVSRRLAALEDDLGSRLFDRLPDGYQPTPAGNDVLEIATRVEAEIQSLGRKVLGADARLSGPLRVSTVNALALRFMDVLRDFTVAYPGVQLTVSSDNQPVSLTKREADVALRLSNSPPEHLVGRKLGRAEFGLYAHRNLVDQIGEDSELDAYPWLGWDEASGAKMTWAWMAEHVPNARVALTVDDSSTFLGALRLGMGIGFATCVLVHDDPDLVRLRGPEPGHGMDLWLLTHADMRHTARVRAFTNYMSERLDALKPALSGELG